MSPFCTSPWLLVACLPPAPPRGSTWRACLLRYPVAARRVSSSCASPWLLVACLPPVAPRGCLSQVGHLRLFVAARRISSSCASPWLLVACLSPTTPPWLLVASYPFVPLRGFTSRACLLRIPVAARRMSATCASSWLLVATRPRRVSVSCASPWLRVGLQRLSLFTFPGKQPLSMLKRWQRPTAAQATLKL